MIDLEAISARCDVVDRVRAAHPWTWSFHKLATAAFEDRKELLEEVKRLQTETTLLLRQQQDKLEKSLNTDWERERLRVEKAEAEIKQLRQELKRAATREATFQRAVDWLYVYGFWDGNCIVAAPGCDKEALEEAWDDLLNASRGPSKELNDMMKMKARAEQEGCQSDN